VAVALRAQKSARTATRKGAFPRGYA